VFNPSAVAALAQSESGSQVRYPYPKSSTPKNSVFEIERLKPIWPISQALGEFEVTLSNVPTKLRETDRGKFSIENPDSRFQKIVF
jgi:hypothetical protein